MFILFFSSFVVHWRVHFQSSFPQESRRQKSHGSSWLFLWHLPLYSSGCFYGTYLCIHLAVSMALTFVLIWLYLWHWPLYSSGYFYDTDLCTHLAVSMALTSVLIWLFLWHLPLYSSGCFYDTYLCTHLAVYHIQQQRWEISSAVVSPAEWGLCCWRHPRVNMAPTHADIMMNFFRFLSHKI